MKSCLVALGSVCALAAFGRTLVWDGGASGDLSDAVWLFEGATVSPEAGDRLVLGAAGAFTNDRNELLLSGIDVTVGGVSLSGAKMVTLAGDGSGLVATGAGEVDVNLPIACGPEAGEVRIDAVANVTLTMSGILSGAAKIVVGSPGTVHFKGENTFTGNLLVSNGVFHAWSDAAFGTADGKTDFDVRRAEVQFHGIETSEALTFTTAQNSKWVRFLENTTNVFHTHVTDTYMANWEFQKNSRTVFNKGFHTLTWGGNFKEGAHVETCGDDSGSNLGRLFDNYMYSTDIPARGSWAHFYFGAKFRFGNSSRGGWINTRFTMKAGVEDAFYFPNPPSDLWPTYGTAPTIRFNGAGSFDLNGFSQHMRDIFTTTQTDAVISNSSPTRATLHLLQDTETATSTTYPGRFAGNLTVSLEGPKPLVVSGTATPDVAFSLDNGASLTVNSANWGGTNFVVRGGSALVLSGAAVSEDTAIDLADGEFLSTVSISGTKTVSALSINGTACGSGEWGPVGSGAENEDEHLTGEGMFVVRGGSEPVGTGKWIGQGSDEKFSTVENWEGGLPSPADATLTFADAGSRALLVRNFSAVGVVFDTPSSSPNFEVAADSGRPNARLGIGTGGIAVSDRQDGVARTNVVSADVSLESAAMIWNIAGAANVLELKGSVSSAVSKTAVTRKGAGTLVLSGDSDFVGSVEIVSGKMKVFGGALGADGNAILSRVTDADGNVDFAFAGGTHGQNFTFERYRSFTHEVRFLSGSTNVMSGLVKLDSDRDLRPTFEADSVTFFKGGIQSTRLYDYEFFMQLRAASQIVFVGQPLVVDTTRVANFYAPNGTVGRRSVIVFDADDCRSKAGIDFSDGIDVRFDRDWVFKTNTFATSLQLSSNNALHPTVDLNGHDQGFGDVYDASNKGGFAASAKAVITSAASAVLHAFQNTADTLSWKPAFQGGAGLEKSGVKTLLLAGVSSTTGTLAVAGGVLGFTGDGAWPNASAISVSGGELDVDRAGRLPAKGLAIRLSGGKLNLGAGVRLRTKDLQVADLEGNLVPCEPGRYTSANLGEYLSGEGEIVVGGGGLMLIFR